jgi:hypothetical protein
MDKAELAGLVALIGVLLLCMTMVVCGVRGCLEILEDNPVLTVEIQKRGK